MCLAAALLDLIDQRFKFGLGAARQAEGITIAREPLRDGTSVASPAPTIRATFVLDMGRHSLRTRGLSKVRSIQAIPVEACQLPGCLATVFFGCGVQGAG